VGDEEDLRVTTATVDRVPAGIRAAHRPTEAKLLRRILTAVALIFLAVFLAIPLTAVFVQALASGIRPYFAAVAEPDAIAALKLTMLTASIAVPSNLAFGLCAAWAIAKFRFRGRSLLTTLVDLPFAVSPVISGLVLVLLTGRQSSLGSFLSAHGLQIVFATPGIVLASIFVSVPFIAREVIPVMEAAGNEQEQAARVLGASGWQTFFRVTLPSIKWGVVYGVILCSARVLGEFGAVAVVSGHVRGSTNTLPLHVEILYNEYRMQAAFAVASILTCLAVVTLVVKTVAERRIS
jgi:sulfate transport system permease protein